MVVRGALEKLEEGEIGRKVEGKKLVAWGRREERWKGGREERWEIWKGEGKGRGTYLPLAKIAMIESVKCMTVRRFCEFFLGS